MSTADVQAPAAQASVEPGADSSLSRPLGLVEAARLYRVRKSTLAEAAVAGHVRAVIRQDRQRRRFFFDPEELAADMAGRVCRYDGCERPGLGPSGGCDRHGHVFLGPRAAGVKRPDLGPIISAANTGRRHRPETIEKLRKYPPEERWCKWCEEPLGLVPGHVIRAGGGRFCADPSHPTLWAWANERERFPQSVGPGAAEFPCAICRRRQVTRWPSQVKIAEAERRRFFCDVCFPLWRGALLKARRAVHEARGRRLEALRQAIAVGEELEVDLVEQWPRGAGRRPPMKTDLAIEAMHVSGGCTDGEIAVALERLQKDEGLRIPGVRGVVDARYVTLRRQRRGIRRRERSAEDARLF